MRPPSTAGCRGGCEASGLAGGRAGLWVGRQAGWLTGRLGVCVRALADLLRLLPWLLPCRCAVYQNKRANVRAALSHRSYTSPAWF